MKKITEPIDGITEIGSMSCEEVVTYLKQRFNVSEVLYYFDSDDLREQISDEYFIADNEKDAIELLIDSGDLEMPFHNAGIGLPDFRKKDSLDLIERIANKEGWNNLYDMLDWYRNRINIP